MKKILLSAAIIAAIGLGSCSKNESLGPVPNQNPNAINFSTYTAQATKAGVTTAANLDQFTVFGYYTTGQSWTLRTDNLPFMGTADEVAGIDVTKDVNGTWGYGDTKFYWPNNTANKISFFAFGPSKLIDVTPGENKAKVSAWTDPSVSGGTRVNPKLTFTQGAAIADQVDLVVASTLNQTKTDPTVDMAFGHILSKVGIAIKRDVTSLPVVEGAKGAKVNLTGVTVKIEGSKVVNKGTYTLGDAGNDGTWANASTTQAAATAVSIMHADFNEDANDIVDATAKNITADTSYLMLVPQDLATEAIKVTISYTITENNMKDEATASAYLPTYTLEQGKQYLFNLVLSRSAVEFANPTVNPWVDGTQANDTNAK